MGSLSLPQAGTIYVDTSVVIYTVERHPAYSPLLAPLWQKVHSGAIGVLSSDLTLLETLVVPLRTGDDALVRDYEALWLHAKARLLPITRDILRSAASLRAASPALRTPDAIHAATSLTSGCALFLTNDPGFRRISGLRVEILDDLLQTP